MKQIPLTALGLALRRLEEALAQPESDLVRDACIQRFEFCFELSWKSIQTAVREQGQDCQSPRACFRQAFRLKWLTEESAWIAMMGDRNLTTHTYDEKLAQEVYSRLPKHFRLLKNLHRSLLQVFESN